MSEMVERVAESVARILVLKLGIVLDAEQCHEVARAAIAAMRGDVVPVFEDISNMEKQWKESALPIDMLNAGECACWRNGGRPFGYNGVLNIWRAMIDAALSEGDKP